VVEWETSVRLSGREERECGIALVVFESAVFLVFPSFLLFKSEFSISSTLEPLKTTVILKKPFRVRNCDQECVFRNVSLTFDIIPEWAYLSKGTPPCQKKR
jgi:hypothetical protein